MPRPIRDLDRQKWRVYLDTEGAQADRRGLTPNEVSSQATAWIGTRANPDNSAMRATVAMVADQHVVLALPGGKKHPVSFQEIIDADAVLRYWLGRGQVPVPDDYRYPDPVIADVKGRRIWNDSYAPALAERSRRTPRNPTTEQPGEANRAAEYRLPDEVVDAPLFEGSVCRVTVNAYERNTDARRRCIEAYLPRCCVCGFDFVAAYGPEFTGFIHVHHLKPLSEAGGEYAVDPVRDLRPVCPNCHAVIHYGGRLRTIDEVRQLLARQRRTQPSR